MLRKILVLLLSAILLAACGNSNTQTTTGEHVGESEQQETKQLSNLETLLAVTKGERGFIFEITFTNKAAEDVELTFPSGQKYEIMVTNEDGEGVYTYSADKTFIQAIEKLVIKAGETLTWEEEWNPMANGIELPAGNYLAEATINILTDVEGILISKDSLVAKAAFNINTEDSELGQEVEQGKETEESEELGEEESGEPLVLENNAFRQIQVTGQDGEYTVTGEGRVFEATMNYAVSDGHVYYLEDFYMLPEGAPSWAPFTLNISIPKDELPVNGTVMLELFEYSAKDGSPINVLFVPLETIGY